MLLFPEISLGTLLIPRPTLTIIFFLLLFQLNFTSFYKDVIIMASFGEQLSGLAGKIRASTSSEQFDLNNYDETRTRQTLHSAFGSPLTGLSQLSFLQYFLLFSSSLFFIPLYPLRIVSFDCNDQHRMRWCAFNL